MTDRRRKVTVQVSVWFEDMMMESTDAALDIVRGVMVSAGEHCDAEIKQALADSGARDVTVHMLAY